MSMTYQEAEAYTEFCQERNRQPVGSAEGCISLVATIIKGGHCGLEWFDVAGNILNLPTSMIRASFYRQQEVHNATTSGR